MITAFVTPAVAHTVIAVDAAGTAQDRREAGGGGGTGGPGVTAGESMMIPRTRDTLDGCLGEAEGGRVRHRGGEGGGEEVIQNLPGRSMAHTWWHAWVKCRAILKLPLSGSESA